MLRVPKRVFWLALLAVGIVLTMGVVLALSLRSVCLKPIFPEVLGNDSGGILVSWIYKNTIYAEMLNGEGKSLWSTAVSRKPAIPTFFKMVPDSSGGAVIVWMDNRAQDKKGEDLYAQRVSANGTILWKESGIPVCVSPGYQVLEDVISDSIGGTIIVWDKMQNDHHEIYAQRLDTTGKVLWQENGIRLVATGAYIDKIRVAGDGLDGNIIAWVDGRSSNYDIYAQHIDFNGRALWQENGIPISTASGYQTDPRIVSDGMGEAIVVWYNSNASPPNISAQRITPEGKCLWQENGVMIGSADGSPMIIGTAQKEVIMTWVDMPGSTASFPGQWALYVQKFNYECETQWRKEPLALSSKIEERLDFQIAYDEEGNTFVIWEASTNPAKADKIYAQKLSPDGSHLWPESGILYLHINFPSIHLLVSYPTVQVALL